MRRALDWPGNAGKKTLKCKIWGRRLSECKLMFTVETETCSWSTVSEKDTADKPLQRRRKRKRRKRKRKRRRRRRKTRRRRKRRRRRRRKRKRRRRRRRKTRRRRRVTCFPAASASAIFRGSAGGDRHQNSAAFIKMSQTDSQNQMKSSRSCRRSQMFPDDSFVWCLNSDWSRSKKKHLESHQVLIRSRWAQRCL